SQLARQSSLDGSVGTGRIGGALGLARPSSSMTNLANISKMPELNLPTRPGSALGIPGHPGTLGGLRGTNLSSGPQLKTGLPACIAQCLPPDLHHLIYTNAGSLGLGDNYGSQGFKDASSFRSPKMFPVSGLKRCFQFQDSKDASSFREGCEKRTKFKG
ncbi:hypothetical protein Pcinc_009061, partial [Petrolisthes cinctipes]